jgi:hypothetical protein
MAPWPSKKYPDAVEGTLKSLDYSLDHLSPEMLKLTGNCSTCWAWPSPAGH